MPRRLLLGPAPVHHKIPVLSAGSQGAALVPSTEGVASQSGRKALSSTESIDPPEVRGTSTSDIDEAPQKADVAKEEIHPDPTLQPVRRKSLLNPTSTPCLKRVPEDAVGQHSSELSCSKGAPEPPTASDSCYAVAFTREAHKKRRKFENGIMHVRGGKVYLFDEEGKHLMLGRSVRVKENEVLPSGRNIVVNAITMIEIEAEIPMEDFTSGRVFNKATCKRPADKATVNSVSKAKRFRPLSTSSGADSTKQTAEHEEAPPLLPGALKLLGADQTLFLEPNLASKLRPHQQEGVCFMFRHIHAGAGCILADSMGLGKTLQALCLIWAALSRPPGRPLCRKAAVVCPSSLCNNWEEECNRWLGSLRLRPIVVQGGLAASTAAETTRSFLCTGKLLIISYEQLRQHADLIDDVVDLLVCDEGHRLKAGGAATTKRLNAMQCKRRILLTGTPLQNSLDEFWCCLNFVQPSLLPPLSTFQRVFKTPIDRAQDASASAQQVALGKARSAELAQLAGGAILRRGPELLETLLPGRTELLLTVPLLVPQVAMYRTICRNVTERSVTNPLTALTVLRQLCNMEPQDLSGERTEGRTCVANAGYDLNEGEGHGADGKNMPSSNAVVPDEGKQNELLRSALASLDESTRSAQVEENSASGKLRLLRALLCWLKDKAPDDGIVIVSGFSRSLDRCGKLCAAQGIPTVTLTGATPVHTRLELVNRFNKQKGTRVFLLSSRAGGVGLNIVGANRLIMLEPDWNPAVDLQSMGRIWRQGQQKPCFIYRLAAHGTLEEKVLQRQERKQGLATVALDIAADRGNVENARDMAELRQVFYLDGYLASGKVLPGTPHAGDHEDAVPEAAGMGSDAIRAALHSVRLLSSAACSHQGS